MGLDQAHTVSKERTEARIPVRRAVAMAAALTRRALARQQIEAFEGERKYYDILGYPKEITQSMYRERYDRQDIAGTIVDLPAQDTWKKPPKVSVEGDDNHEFSQAWRRLTKRRGLGLWNKLTRGDKLSGIGRFGVILIGFKDGSGDLANEVNVENVEGVESVIYMRPFPESKVKIEEFVDDVQDPRYGQPLIYKLLVQEGETEADEEWKEVHYTRILHLAENKTDNETYGTPRLQRVFNRLDDLMKLVGGGAEATWLNMRKGTILRPMEGYDPDTLDMDKLEEELEEYVHDPARLAYLIGIETEELGEDHVVDVSAPFEVAFSLIAAASRIPQRVLIGSAQGQLSAAEEDMRQWAGEIAYRQKTYAEPQILRPLIDRLMEFGVLPQVEEYHIGTKGEDGEYRWPPLVQMSEKELAEIQSNRASAVKSLSDPMGDYPIGEGEKRELLNFPKERPIEEIPTEDEVLDMMRQMKVGVENGEYNAGEVLDFTMGVYADVMDRIQENRDGK